ncbi:MAG: amidohydrolase family protein [Bacillota bacterium]
MLDLLITGGVVMNGTGGPWFRADVGIDEGRIAFIGDSAAVEARKAIDAEGLVVAPGFIDIHSHSDSNLLINPAAESKVRQGVTTEVIGQCGVSAAPVQPEQIEEMKEHLPDSPDLQDLCWSSMADYLSLLESRGVAVNCVALAGHGNIRRLVVGEEDREPTPDELDRMCDLLRETMEAGAAGMSSGLIYPPGVYSDTAELIALARVLGECGGIYFTHIRNEGDRHEESLREAVEIGRGGDCPVQVSHFKLVGEANWGGADRALRQLESARAEGVDVTADQYPYIATATGLTASLPAWAHDGGREAMLGRLRDRDARRVLKEEMPDGGWDRLVISQVGSEANRTCEGMSVADIADERGLDPRDTVFNLLLEEDGNVGSVRFALSEEDVREIMAHPLVMVGSDGSALAPRGILGRGKPHPRSYGTFPRVLGKYAREEGIIPLETAIAKMTSRPAARLGLWDRGLLLPGFWADVVVFNPDTVRDRATFTDPHRFPVGVEVVLVNGEIVVADDGQRDVRPGQVLRKD